MPTHSGVSRPRIADPGRRHRCTRTKRIDTENAITYSLARLCGKDRVAGGRLLARFHVPSRPAAPRRLCPTPSSASAPSAHQKVLGSYCVTCHNERLRTGGLAVRPARHVGRRRDTRKSWEKVLLKLRMGAMPPPGRPRPDKPTLDAFVSWLEDRTGHRRGARRRTRAGPAAFTASIGPNTRTPSAICSGLDIDVDSLLPVDDADKNGFDNMANMLSVSPTLLDRYLAAARKLSRLALGIAAGRARHRHLQGSDPARSERPGQRRSALRVARRLRDPSLLSRSTASTSQGPPAAAALRLRDRPRIAAPARGARRRRARAVVTVGGGDAERRRRRASSAKSSAIRRGRSTRSTPMRGLEVRFRVKAGPRVVGVAFVSRQAEAEDGVPAARTVRRAPRRARRDARGEPGDRQRGDRRTVPRRGSGRHAEPPHDPRLPAASGSATEEEACARRILSSIARRAYRRPVTDREIATLLAFLRGRPAGWQLRQRHAVRARTNARGSEFPVPGRARSGEPRGGDGLSPQRSRARVAVVVFPLEQRAGRRAARRGRAREAEGSGGARAAGPAHAGAIRDRKTALVDNFVGAVAAAAPLGSAEPSDTAFPDFDENLREAFRQETKLFVDSTLREDRSVVELLSANYTFVNERLARHYRFPTSTGAGSGG